MRAFLLIAAFLVATLLPAVFGMAAQEKVSTVSRAMLNKIFSEELSSVEAEANLRVELEGGRFPVGGHFVVYDFGEGRPCQEQNILQLSSMRLNTCFNLVDGESNEKGFVLYAQRDGDQIFGRSQSFADSACTKKRGWPRKTNFRTDTCMNGVKYEIAEDLDFSSIKNGVAEAIYSKTDACTNHRYNNILIAVATPHNICHENDDNDPDHKTTACGAQVSYTSYASSDGTCTGSASPSTRPLLDCEQIQGPAGNNVWRSEYCL